MRPKAIEWINWIRCEELAAIRQWLAAQGRRGANLLEIGGGNGFLANELTTLGFQVTSIDPRPREPSYFPVQPGNSTQLSFADDSFDVIFSSNVLEHIPPIDAAIREMKRVLKPGGIMIHTMPTPMNTLLTMLGQPIGYWGGLWFVLRQAAGLLRKALPPSRKAASLSSKETHDSSAKPTATGQSVSKADLIRAMELVNPLRLLIPEPHGVSPSCFEELWDWRPKVWCDRFGKHGLTVKEVKPLPLAYSRHALLPFRGERLRRYVARKGKSSGLAYRVQG